jgi:hypothetical protein
MIPKPVPGERKCNSCEQAFQVPDVNSPRMTNEEWNHHWDHIHKIAEEMKQKWLSK